MDSDKPCKATDPKDVEDRVMNVNIPKTEGEHLARDEIIGLRLKLATARNDALERAALFFDEWVEHDEMAMKYRDKTGVETSSREELKNSLSFARFSAKEIRAMKDKNDG